MKPIASLSLDLDNQWSYMKTHGDEGWETFPSYLDVVVPRIITFLKDRHLKITFFIVGQDAALEKNHPALKQIVDAGHEIGNHSFNHEPWLHLYSKDQLDEEFEKTEAAIALIYEKKLVGFRGPGYSLSPTVLEVLATRGYEYDCSTLPTYIGPFARAYYFFKSPQMTDREKEKRNKLFGKLSDGAKTLKPHFVDTVSRTLVEIPVTTFPFVKTPIHASYLLYLSTLSQTAALAYWRSALLACKLTGVQPSLLLHPLDFLCGDDVSELKFFPGMGMSLGRKLNMMSAVLSIFAENFDVVSMGEHAAAVRLGSSSPNARATVIGEAG
jgi:peptidoglycan/xylan/chitin deacetylase (PgdA/CDA1 family)